MWQKIPVYQKYPTLTKNGKSRYFKEFVKQPRDIECWFSFATHNDIDGLKRIFARNMNINIQNLEDKNIGVLACEYNFPKVFNFFIQSGGELDNLKLESFLGTSFKEITCSPKVGLTIFKLFYNEQYIKNIMKMTSLTKFIQSLHQYRLFESDKNIQKIKYLLKFFSIEEQLYIKNLIFSYISHGNLHIPKMLFFISNKEYLKNELNLKLKNNKHILKKFKI